ncbi:hypothetical protein KSS87_015043, partial [Heliosperma pusillum]
MTTVTSRDIQDIVTKLSSDKSKIREEGIKLLNTWLKGERSISFCKYLSRKTAMLKSHDIAGVETWPFLVSLLILCTKEEISGSKKRDPKLLFAKTLRTVVQFAQDNKGHGHHLPLIMITKDLFTHILEVFRGVPSFHSEYAVLLRHVLTVRDYRFHMKKAHYCELVVMHIEKVKVSLSEEHLGKSRYCAEECFKHLMTLHFLLENPPGDFPSKIRKKLVDFFTDFKLTARDVWRIPRKFIECLNAYLLKDGPNLGGESLVIHNSVKTFVFSNWHQRPDSDTDLKDVLISYAKLQLHLRRGNEEESELPLLDELSKIISRDLEHCSIPCIGTSRLDKFAAAGAKDEKIGTLASSNHNLLELAALVVYRSFVGVNKRPLATKRARNQSTADYLLDQLQHGTWVWHAVLCYLCCNYKSRLPKDHIVCWFDGICSSFERHEGRRSGVGLEVDVQRSGGKGAEANDCCLIALILQILSDASKGHNYDGLLWTLRSLHQLFPLLPPLVSAEKFSPKSLSASNKLVRGWQAVWKSLIHGLPLFSSVAHVADAAFRLLGDMIAHSILVMTEVPRDVWDLQCFRDISSLSALYFISCYFSRKGSQGDLRDNLHLRQSILRRVISIITRKATLKLDEHFVILLPAAVYAICVGASDILNYYRGLYPAYCGVDTSGMTMDWLEGKEQRHEESDENFECLISIVAEINTESADKEPSTLNSQGVRLPRQLQDPLLSEMESCVLHELTGRKNERNQLHDIFLHCSLLSNLLYGSMIMRKNDDLLPFRTELCNCLVGMIESATLVIQDSMRDSKSCGFWSSSLSSDGACSAVASLKNFLSCPILYGHGMNGTIDPILTSTILSVERLLMALSTLYLQLHEYWKNVQFETTISEVSGSSIPADNFLQPVSSNSRLIDMELDSADDSPDVVCGTTAAGMSFGWSRRKMDTISLITCGFSVLPIVTWDILFDILNAESDPKVCEYILLRLCQKFHCLSARKLTNLVAVIDDMIEQKSSQSLDLFDVLSPVSCLSAKMLSLNHGGKDKDSALPLEDKNFAQSLMHLGDLVIKVFESNLLDRRGRLKLVDCICDFIGLNPQIGQTMIQKLLILLSDPDYRVRLLLARRLGILFLSWDGHDVLFQDICSNFDPRLKFCPKGRLVTKIKDLGAYSQLLPAIETIVVTLMHVAFYSEKMELEAVFRICMISTHHPYQRDLVKAALDNLARQLHYSCRSKYLEELMGPLIFRWVACGMGLEGLVQYDQVLNISHNTIARPCNQGLTVSTPAFMLQCLVGFGGLLEIVVISRDDYTMMISASVYTLLGRKKHSRGSRQIKMLGVFRGFDIPIMDLFVLDIEQSHFLQYCCQWLVPALILHEDTHDSSALQWLAEQTGQTVPALVISYFPSVFSICMALHCCNNSESQKASAVLRSKILQFAVISEGDRDMLIKKHMVCIPGLDNYHSSEGVIDKINIFRPDRVFMILIELHYKVTAAVNQRHVAHHLAGVEVLIRILGHRVAVASTYCYLLNLVGQFISIPSLQDQCCHMISLLLKMCKSNTSEETTRVLGEQLQYLVAKLVSCCIPSGSNTEISSPSSSQVLSLLHLLIVDSDPCLHAFIKVSLCPVVALALRFALGVFAKAFKWFFVGIRWVGATVRKEIEPFPDLEAFHTLKTFHGELCRGYSQRDYFLKVGTPILLLMCQAIFLISMFLDMRCGLYIAVCKKIFGPSTKAASLESPSFSQKAPWQGELS